MLIPVSILLSGMDVLFIPLPAMFVTVPMQKLPAVLQVGLYVVITSLYAHYLAIQNHWIGKRLSNEIAYQLMPLNFFHEFMKDRILVQFYAMNSCLKVNRLSCIQMIIAPDINFKLALLAVLCSGSVS